MCHQIGQYHFEGFAVKWVIRLLHQAKIQINQRLVGNIQ